MLVVVVVVVVGNRNTNSVMQLVVVHGGKETKHEKKTLTKTSSSIGEKNHQIANPTYISISKMQKSKEKSIKKLLKHKPATK